MRDTDDALLIALAQRGSLDAVAELFERYWPVAWQAAFAVTGNIARADDAAQDAIQRAFAALDRPTVAGFELSVGAWRRPDAAVIGRRTRTRFGA